MMEQNGAGGPTKGRSADLALGPTWCPVAQHVKQSLILGFIMHNYGRQKKCFE